MMFGFTATPRICSISPRVIGWRYATSARVSSRAREYFAGRSCQRRDTGCATDGRTWMRNPLATSTSSSPRASYSARKAVSAACTVSTAVPSRSSKSDSSSSVVNGRPAASRAASITLRTYWSFMSLCRIFAGDGVVDGGIVGGGVHHVVGHELQPLGRIAEPHVQRRIRLGLHDVDQALAQQLENGDEGHRDAAAALLGLEQADEIDERARRSAPTARPSCAGAPTAVRAARDDARTCRCAPARPGTRAASPAA